MKQQEINKSGSITKLIFFGNYFYGICAVALAIEGNLQQQYPLNHFWYFFVTFVVTVLYYNYPYIRNTAVPRGDPRTKWYNEHYHLLYWNQVISTIVVSAFLIYFLAKHGSAVLNMSLRNWFFFLIFPAAAGAYYGFNALFGKFNLRNIGILKPFMIGFTWAGLATVYPILFQDVLLERDYDPGLRGFMLFVKNLMFITLLCVMFDIKDYAEDYVQSLKTFVVKIGLRKTIFFILLPFALIGLGTFIYYAISQNFSPAKIILNIIPFILLIAVAFSLRKRRSIMYYLMVVDGLMLVKAICGSVAMVYF